MESASAKQEEDAKIWSLGSSGSYDGSFQPLSLNSDLLGEGGGSLGSFGFGSLGGGQAEMMDLGEDEDDSAHVPAPPVMHQHRSQQQQQQQQQEQQSQFDASQGTKRARVSFPDHPGPVLPLVPPQMFDIPIQPGMGGTRSSMELLNKIYHFQTSQRQNLDKLRLAQWQILSRPSPDAVAALLNQETHMENDTKSALQALVHIWCNWVLSPAEVWRWEFLWADLHIQLEQIVLYLREVRNEPGPRCAIAIISHPFPTVATRGRTVDGAAIVVQLLTAASVSLQDAALVRADAVIPKGTKGKLPGDLMENNAAALQPDTRHAEFRLKFANGTRKQPVQFQFRVLVTTARPGGGLDKFEVASAVTPPSISVTNEVQWEEAEGMLLERVAFQHGEQCQWPSMCNYLQRHLIHATRQNVCQLARIFSLAELSYFQRTFFRSNTVSLAQFQEFWKWYGKAAHKIRYSKHVLALFLQGLLCGFIAKSEMELALSGRPPGTFMIRFSERNAGSFSIAYVSQDPNANGASMIRHYLVSHEDITQRKSLADFVGESPALTHFLRLVPRSGFNLVVSPLGNPVEYEVREKHAALGDFYAKREAVQQTSGYDSQLNPQPPAHVFQRSLEDPSKMDGQSVLGHGLGSAAGSVSPSLSGIFGSGRSALDADFGAVDSCWDAE